MSLDKVEGFAGAPLTQKRFGELIGMPKSTVNDWYHGPLPPEIRYFLCALERIPEPARLELLREWCRPCPRLDDPRLAHDPMTGYALRELAARSSGLTLVRGGSDSARTYLLTAVGHAVERAGEEVRGVDLHNPLAFVPVAGVLYLRNSAALAQARELVSTLLVDLARTPARLLLLNGLWEACPSVGNFVIGLAKSRHVITTGGAGECRAGSPVTVVNVSEDTKGRISIGLEADRRPGYTPRCRR